MQLTNCNFARIDIDFITMIRFVHFKKTVAQSSVHSKL